MSVSTALSDAIPAISSSHSHIVPVYSTRNAEPPRLRRRPVQPEARFPPQTSDRLLLWLIVAWELRSGPNMLEPSSAIPPGQPGRAVPHTISIGRLDDFGFGSRGYPPTEATPCALCYAYSRVVVAHLCGELEFDARAGPQALRLEPLPCVGSESLSAMACQVLFGSLANVRMETRSSILVSHSAAGGIACSVLGVVGSAATALHLESGVLATASASTMRGQPDQQAPPRHCARPNFISWPDEDADSVSGTESTDSGDPELQLSDESDAELITGVVEDCWPEPLKFRQAGALAVLFTQSSSSIISL